MHRVVILQLLLLFLFSAGAAAQETSCENLPEVVVLSGEPAQIAEVCRASELAIAFLAKYGLTPKRSIRFEFVETKIDSHGYIAYGSYDSRSDQIQLMTYAAILANAESPTMYSEPFDRGHYSGAIAHEVAHAVVQHNLQSRRLSNAAQEYLAHSVQLAVLPEARRQKIIRVIAIEPWQSGDVISEVYMALEPGRFAVKSYLHLTTMANPQAFVQILLHNQWFYINVP
ncbi:MAG TPA: DUF6639 family protein [Malonomonas sp.]